MKELVWLAELLGVRVLTGNIPDQSLHRCLELLVRCVGGRVVLEGTREWRGLSEFPVC